MEASITRNNIGRSIAIVLDNNVYSFPNVNNEITGGSSQITGNFTPEEANDLANVLKSGKMSAKVEVVSNNVIGPSLGAEAIQMGFISFVVAIFLLMVLMVVYYGWIPGLVANVGLILNLYFTFGILASLQAVLTLSGIAGIVLLARYGRRRQCAHFRTHQGGIKRTARSCASGYFRRLQQRLLCYLSTPTSLRSSPA